MTLRQHVLTRAEVDATADLLARALDDDPAYRFLFPREGGRYAGLRAFFRGNLMTHLPFGCTFVAHEAGTICATVTLRPPEGFRVTALAMIRSGLLSFAVAHGRRTVGRVLALKRVYDDLESAAAGRTPHWHIHMMAVDPRRQGRGVGSQLLADVLARTAADDGARRPIVLTTHKPQNVTFYRRSGFEVVGERDVALGAPYRVWSMRRG
jgi:ribosomal protein S18 acetylase RimI-like enzyme